jgi:lipopolysaccharide heptosyltransferase II
VNIKLIKYIDKVFGALFTRLLTTPNSQTIRIPQNILVIRPGGIGDAILLLPSIRLLKNTYPDATITVLAERRNCEVFSLSPTVDRLLLYDRPGGLLQAIRGEFDVVIDSEQWHRLSAVAARLTGAPLIIGYGTNVRARLFTHLISYSHNDYEMNSFFNLLTPLGIDHPDEIVSPFLVVPDVARQKVEAMLGSLVTKPFVAIFSGASIPERRWWVNKFGEMAARLFQKGIPVVVVGGKADAADGENIVARKFGLNLAGRTSLAETAAVIDMSNLLVSGDSGILHIGVGLGKPTVSLFGPGIAKKWAPRGPRHTVINKNLPCSPCTKYGYTSKCPVNARCMAEITVDEVVAAVEKLIRSERLIDKI